MGTNQFQREYIEYLQERNTELLNKLNNLKENYENKILAKDLNKHYLISALEDVLNVCTVIPQEIDLFFDKMTAAMGAFKNILLRKSELVQMVEKISKIINPPENIGQKLISVSDSNLVKEHISETNIGRKAGTVKVSPMINGHIISTEPRIYLSRVPGVFTPGGKNETHQLSPIIEASPNTSSDLLNLEGHIFREIKIPLERINLNKISYNYINEESPKSRFKGPKRWKKSLSSNKPQSDQKNSVFLEHSENLSKKFSVGEVELPHLPDDEDPLEGPSWLYEGFSEMNSSSSNFMDYKRRKHRFATMFDKNEDCITYLENLKGSVEGDSNQFYQSVGDEEDEKDLEGEKKLNESSNDFISESFVSDCEDNNSPEKIKCKNSRRSHIEKFNESKFSKNKKLTPVAYSKNEKKIYIPNTPIQSPSSGGENNEERSFRFSTEEKKRALEASLNKRSREPFFEKTASKAEPIEEEIETSKKSKSKRSRKKSVKDVSKSNVIVKLESRVSTEEFTPKNSKKSSPDFKEKSKKSRSGTKSKNPMVCLSDCTDRKKRKAAPAKLIEPKLNTKLRRM